MRSEIEIKKKNEISSDTSLSDQCVGKDVEPDILNCTNIPLYDLKLFQEAQGVAAEKIVSTFMLTSSNTDILLILCSITRSTIFIHSKLKIILS